MRSSLAYALSKGPVKKAVEVGCQTGANAKEMLKKGVEFLYLIDPFLPYEDTWNDNGKSTPYRKFMDKSFQKNAKEEMLKRLSSFNGRTKFLEMTSEEAASQIEGNLDYVYIDGNHDYYFVKKDMEVLYPKLKEGGVMGGHDFSAAFPGLIRAVKEFADGVGKKVVYNSEDTDWWMK